MLKPAETPWEIMIRYIKSGVLEKIVKEKIYVTNKESVGEENIKAV